MCFSMDYSKLSDVYESLEKTPSKLGKRDILSELFRSSGKSDLERMVLLSQGRVFPASSSEELGVADSLVKKAISRATGHSESKVEAEYKKVGDLGIAAENLAGERRQSTLMKKRLTVEFVVKNLRELPMVSGGGSQERKLGIISELISSADAKEARYIVRTVLGTLRIGVAEGVVRDAISKAFDVSKDKVEHAWNMMPDFGAVAVIARDGGNDGLDKVGLRLGTSIQVLLAEKAPDIKSALDAFKEADIEVKYDGARVQIHKDGTKIKAFTRRLEDVTHQFPDLVELAKAAIKPRSAIIDADMLAIDKKTGRPLTFQSLSQRIKRKYDIEKMVGEIPIQVNAFDILLVDGKPLLDKSLRERRKHLAEAIKVIPDKFQLAKSMQTNDLKIAEAFYKKALEDGQEGVMVKNLESNYQPGRRVGFWLKVKPEMEPLDLVVTGAEWGTGKRAKWLSSFILSCKDESSGRFVPCGMMGTGLSDEQFEDMTKTLKGLIVEDIGRSVSIRPQVVLEIGYQEIQKSPKYESGYALRFPRMIRDRSADKGPNEADTLDRVEELFKSQKKQ
jgi:DNA ligase 1